MHFRQKEYIHTENATLFCQLIGDGKPLLIIHGGAGDLTQDYLLPHMEWLAFYVFIKEASYCKII